MVLILALDYNCVKFLDFLIAYLQPVRQLIHIFISNNPTTFHF